MVWRRKRRTMRAVNPVQLEPRTNAVRRASTADASNSLPVRPRQLLLRRGQTTPWSLGTAPTPLKTNFCSRLPSHVSVV